ncbi:MAG: class I SAM-dependent methyltransferase [Acetobacteraceae bacterium]
MLDPAVGDGALLLSLLAQIAARTAAPVAVHGFETDPASLCCARQRLGAAFPAAELHLEHGDFLDFALGSPAMPGFDLIIANPPTCGTQIMGSCAAQKLGSAFGLRGRVDLYHAFLIGMAQALRPGGTAGIIVSNRFMTTKGGASLRAALRTRFALGHVWDLGDTKLFDAAVLPAVILAAGQTGVGRPAPRFTAIYQTDAPATAAAADPIAALAMSGAVANHGWAAFSRAAWRARHARPADELWRIATVATDTWLATVAAHTWKVFGSIGKIRVGVKTCADPVFIRSDWDAMPETERPNCCARSPRIIAPAAFAAVAPGQRRAILYPHENAGGRRRPADLAQYPKSLAYLEAHRATLEGRTLCPQKWAALV